MAKGKFALPISTGGVGGGSYIIREYTSSTTWTKLPGLLEVFVVCIGGGGGGGGAGSSAAGTVRRGGGGGVGSAIMFRRIRESTLPASGAVTVGAGGEGGAGQSGVTGLNGGDGGQSSFLGLLITSTSNLGGNGGGNNTGGGTSSWSGAGIFPGVIPYTLNGVNGVNSSTTGGNGSAGSTSSMGAFGISGGAGGAGIPSSNSEGSSGGAGSRVVLIDGSLTIAQTNTSVNPVGTAGPNGVHNLALQLLYQFAEVSYLTIGVGSSGVGGRPGDAAGTINGGNGGNGGDHGSGGAGGGGATSPAFGGSGGNGGNGCVIVMEVY